MPHMRHSIGHSLDDVSTTFRAVQHPSSLLQPSKAGQRNPRQVLRAFSFILSSQKPVVNYFLHLFVYYARLRRRTSPK